MYDSRTYLNKITFNFKSLILKLIENYLYTVIEKSVVSHNYYRSDFIGEQISAIIKSNCIAYKSQFPEMLFQIPWKNNHEPNRNIRWCLPAVNVI